MKFYKYTNQDEIHYGLKYHTGLNIDILPFNPTGDCEPRGIYFAREDILAFIDYPGWIREVRLPKGEPIYKNPGNLQKWKAHRVILGPRKPVNAKTIKALIADGADIHICEDWALRMASVCGLLAIVRVLIAKGANVHACNDEALHMASANGYLAIVRELIKAGADIHADNDNALREAAISGHLAVVRVLIAAGADVHACDDYVLRAAAANGHLAVVRVLLKAGADVHARDDDALRCSADHGHLEVVRELKRALKKQKEEIGDCPDGRRKGMAKMSSWRKGEKKCLLK